jgi:hypothetical protein
MHVQQIGVDDIVGEQPGSAHQACIFFSEQRAGLGE